MVVDGDLARLESLTLIQRGHCCVSLRSAESPERQIKPRKRCASGDPQLQIFRLPFRDVAEQSLEGVFCFAMASDYQPNHLVGSRPVVG